MNIAVVAGGLSPERDVSLSSAGLIASSLLRLGHRVVLLDVCYPIDPDSPEAAFSDTLSFSHAISESEPDLDAVRKDCGCGNALIGKGVLTVCQRADLVFVALHGAMGENGQMQAVLESLGIPHTGSGYAGCLLTMNKALTKMMLANSGIHMAPSIVVKAEEAEEKALAFGLPCVIKPCSCGSSCGVSIVSSPDQLHDAVQSAFRYEKTLLIEKRIFGREFAAAVLLDQPLPAIEIIPKSSFYDYKNKYQSGMTLEVCPADLKPEQENAIRQAALTVHRTLGLHTYSRCDFLLDEATGTFCFLEVNTLPGMTPTSLLPQEAAAAGIGYDKLVSMIVADALEN